MIASHTVNLFSEPNPKPLHGQGVIHIGTSGFSFPDWRGVFFPENLKRSDWLKFYAQHFTTVEINASYYRVPTAKDFETMAGRTPDDFAFWVKVPGGTTHSSDPLEPLLDSFTQSLKPLQESGKLRGVLAQFPFSFRKSPLGIERILKMAELLDDISLAVEFRRDEWCTDDMQGFFSDHGLIWVTVDLPEISGLPGRALRVTGNAAYLRLHGRNNRTWFHQELGDRYDYEYKEAELSDWVSKLSHLDEMAGTSYIFFNNCHAGQAVKNAKMLRALLESELQAGLK